MLIPVCVGEPANASFLDGGVVRIQGAKEVRVVVEAEAIDEDESIVDEDAAIIELRQNTLSQASGEWLAMARWRSMDRSHWWVVRVGVNQGRERSIFRVEVHEGASRLPWWWRIGLRSGFGEPY